MTTQTETETKTPAAVEPGQDRAALQAEAASLVELTKKVDKEDTSPCPGCNIRVSIKLNQCPHCESNIAPHNALTRESLRRLAEIQAELDGRHEELAEADQNRQSKPTVKEKFKRLFTGAPVEEEPEISVQDVAGPRLLDNLSEGDQLKVLECAGPWLKVKCRDGRTGWVYSTLAGDR